MDVSFVYIYAIFSGIQSLECLSIFSALLQFESRTVCCFYSQQSPDKNCWRIYMAYLNSLKIFMWNYSPNFPLVHFAANRISKVKSIISLSAFIVLSLALSKREMKLTNWHFFFVCFKYRYSSLFTSSHLRILKNLDVFKWTFYFPIDR